MISAVEAAASAIIALINTVLTVYFTPIVIYFLFKSENKPLLKKHSKSLSLAVIVPAYRESLESLSLTVNSIMSQKYPKNMFTIYFILEQGDQGTISAAESLTRKLSKNGFKVNILVRKEARWGKADALNYVLNNVGEDVFVVFDADDIVHEKYFEEISSVLQGGFDVYAPKVYRCSSSFLGKLIYLDTILWYDIYLKTLFRLSKGYIPLSGEGLAVRTNVLKKINGFPRVLAEDAMLTLYLAKYGFKIFYGDMVILEKTPRKLANYLAQRTRWFQGYYQCLMEAFRTVGKVNARTLTWLLVAYMSPVAALAMVALFTVLIPLLILGKYSIINPLILYWSIGLLVIGTLALIVALIKSTGNTMYKISYIHVLAAPIYWYLNGILALTSIILPKKWRKTIRT